MNKYRKEVKKKLKLVPFTFDLVTLRKAFGYTRADIEELTGLSPTAIRSLEKDPGRSSVRSLRAYGAVLGLDVTMSIRVDFTAYDAYMEDGKLVDPKKFDESSKVLDL